MVSGFVLISGGSPTCFSTASNIFEKKRLHVSMLSVWADEAAKESVGDEDRNRSRVIM